MTAEKMFSRFASDFEALKRNRENVPIDTLTTRYAKSYNALIQRIIEYADWFTDEYIKALGFPINPEDKAGNDALREHLNQIIEDECSPGHGRDKYRAALIDDLDNNAFENAVWQIYDRMLREAYDPYWQKHCHWRNGQIYNDIIQKFWWPAGQNTVFKDGSWVDSKYQHHDSRFPPNIADPKPAT